MAEHFLDTNVLLYLLSSDPKKADCAEALVSAGGVVSVQVLNEFASVAVRKLKMSFPDTREALGVIRTVCRIVPVNEQTHDLGMQVAERFKLSIYDAMILAAAQIAGCKTVLSEDMQDGQVFCDDVEVRNPFR